MKSEGQIVVPAQAEREMIETGSDSNLSAYLPENSQNVSEKSWQIRFQKELSKIKDDPTMYLKINNLKNDKMPDATMLLILNQS